MDFPYVIFEISGFSKQTDTETETDPKTAQNTLTGNISSNSMNSKNLKNKNIIERQCKFSIGNTNKLLVQRILNANCVLPSHDSNFSLSWTPTFPNLKIHSPLQKINHFPRSKKNLSNKASLALIIQSSPYFSKVKAFFPITFVLPDDREKLFNIMKCYPKTQFIVKPPNGSCGSGIKIVTFNDFYSIQRGYVVSEYISKPLCIDGFKFDMRVYVLVTSFAPLRAFVAKEGLARFATESYTNYSTDSYVHLTNATLNKHSKHWSSDFKWKLTELLTEINHRYNVSEEEIMEKIINVISVTLALVQPSMAPKVRTEAIEPYFELYGFDLLLDRKFDIWLLEINTNPSLNYNSDIDCQVKAPLIAQALSIAGIVDMNPMNLPNSVNVDDIEKFDNEIIEGEDERNELSGGGFIRIYPNPKADLYNSFLSNPKYHPLTQVKDSTNNIEDGKLTDDPISLGKNLTLNQSSSILLRYLSRLEQKLRNNSLLPKIQNKLQLFLIMKGFDSKRVRKNLRAVLHNYIIQQRLLIPPKTREIPDKLDKLIDNKGDSFLAEMIINSPFFSSLNCSTLF